MIYDYLIVGQGIAGSLLAWQLADRGASIKIIDAPQQTSATEVAAGIINPITGRRLVKSWMIDELLPVAQQLYQVLERTFSIPFFYERPLIRTIYNRGDENDWLARQGDPAYQDFLGDIGPAGPFTEITTPAFAYGQIHHAAQVDIGILQHRLRQHWLDQDCLHETLFEHKKLKVEPLGVQYESIKAHRLIFCEGWRATQNPYFQDLPFACTKGEAVQISIPYVELSSIFKHRVVIAPIKNEHYWVGATSSHEFEHDLPTEKSFAYFKTNLDRILKDPYHITAHRAAIRPTVKDRRPFLGQHPDYPSLYIFNGLGTKGASLAPYWSQHFLSYLSGKTSLSTAVDIRRFTQHQ